MFFVFSSTSRGYHFPWRNPLGGTSPDALQSESLPRDHLDPSVHDADIEPRQTQQEIDHVENKIQLEQDRFRVIFRRENIGVGVVGAATCCR